MAKNVAGNPEQAFELAKQAAISAGARILEVRRDLIIEKAGRDIKHRADLESERIILNLLEKSSPYPILTEESGEIGKLDLTSYFWIIDPLDGTLNFTRGIDFSCVSLSLWHGNEPLLGVINDFNRGEMFSGINGRGAWCNHRAISVSREQNVQQAVLATGFPVNRDFSSAAIGSFIQHIRGFKKIRLLGSAALSLAYVACGRVDAYTEEDIMFWDVAAGIALVRAASGFVSFQNSKSKPWAKDVWAGEVLRDKGEEL